jgi:hypothetical protein
MSSNTNSNEDQLAYAVKNLECLQEWIGRYDNKLIIILGIDTAMLGALVSLVPPFQVWTPIMILLVIGTIIALGASFVFIYMGSYPRTSGPEKSLWYFGSISKMKYSEYERTYLTRTMNEHLIDVLKQCYRNSEILSLKFYYLKWAYIALLVSVFTWVITIFLFKTIKTT